MRGVTMSSREADGRAEGIGGGPREDAVAAESGGGCEKGGCRGRRPQAKVRRGISPFDLLLTFRYRSPDVGGQGQQRCQ
jgi:hypothetical protein